MWIAELHGTAEQVPCLAADCGLVTPVGGSNRSFQPAWNVPAVILEVVISGSPMNIPGEKDVHADTSCLKNHELLGIPMTWAG